MFRVLLVDQNEHTLQAMKSHIDWNAMEFIVDHTIHRFQDVIPYLAHNSISLIVINIHKAYSSGIMLVNQIRKMNRVPILLTGGKDDFRIARKALTYQVHDYLTDALNPTSLFKSLSSLKKELLDNSFTAAHSSQLANKPHVISSYKPYADQTIYTIKQYVQQELHQNITLKKISSKLHFNCAYLGQKFKQYEQMSFNEYLLQQRMERAKHMLLNTNKRIYEIANEVGYTEIDWFYKKFKEYTGISANKYRKKFELSNIG